MFSTINDEYYKIQVSKTNFKQARQVLDTIKFEQHMASLVTNYRETCRLAKTDEQYLPHERAAKSLIIESIEAKLLFLEEGDAEQFKSALLKSVKKARKILDTDPDWKYRLSKFLMIIIAFPITVPLYFTGFFKPSMAKKVDALETA